MGQKSERNEETRVVEGKYLNRAWQGRLKGMGMGRPSRLGNF